MCIRIFLTGVSQEIVFPPNIIIGFKMVEI